MGIFNKIQLKKPKHSIFDLSYDNKLSFKMGYLIPVHLQECVPGDHFSQSSEAMFRMMPMVAPIMHKVDIYMHFFFVPNRLVWPNWEKYFTGGQDPDIGVPNFPIMNWVDGNVTVDVSSLGDYLGLPPNVDFDLGQIDVNAIPFAAYYAIWHEYYRDQNLIAEDPIQLVDGMQPIAVHNKLIELRKRAWEHDYFTSCLPFAQKGDAVELPIDFSSDPAAVKYRDAFAPDSGKQIVRDTAGNPLANATDMGSDGSGFLIENGNLNDVMLDPNGSLYVDPEDLVGITTINDLRTAFSLQKWLEKNARAGSRAIETILAHFGVRSSDKRLQRPEYLGGSKASMAISEVLQTSSTDATTPQANMAGHGIGISGGKNFSYFCEEHGYIMGLLSVRPKTAYYQGIPRHFSKTVDRTQFYWPDFAYLGEQAVLNKEVYASVNANYNEGTFGYIPRYSEYRYNASRVAGQMRDTLEFWHMGRKFATPPALNASFVEANPTKRIFAVDDPNEDEIVGHIYHKIIAKRPLPIYGNPGGL